ncbi:uncharacterized protein LOC128966212 isoform X2 [Oppia nitens]|uniref:uncharacterized protein LOC128966212 isoform X2 n=1 Tax=Oppia nitens TaxID=1686743 RepID=UPI0023D9A860|nr:uncharacterized protein LOC128966212 isoform X2 [Oppia nitens]
MMMMADDNSNGKDNDNNANSEDYVCEELINGFDAYAGHLKDLIKGLRLKIKQLTEELDELTRKVSTDSGGSGGGGNDNTEVIDQLLKTSSLLAEENEELKLEKETMALELNSMENEVHSLNQDKDMMSKELREVRHENDLLIQQMQKLTQELNNEKKLIKQYNDLAKSIFASNSNNNFNNNHIVNSLPAFSEQMVLSQRPNSVTTFGSFSQCNGGLRLQSSQSHEDDEETYHSARRQLANQASKETASDETFYDAKTSNSHRSSLTTTAATTTKPQVPPTNEQTVPTESGHHNHQQQQHREPITAATGGNEHDESFTLTTTTTTTTSNSFEMDDNDNLKLLLVKVPYNRLVAVSVAYAVSPSDFYLHINPDDVYNYIHVIQLKQVELADKPNSRLTPADIVLGMYCSAIYSADGNWYRAQITSVQYENDVERDSIKSLTVHFIDWGNSEEVPLSRVMRLSRDLNKRKQAIHCYIQGLAYEDIRWSSKRCKEFRDLLEKNGNNNRLSGSFQKGQKVDEQLDSFIYPVDLVILDDDGKSHNLVNLMKFTSAEEEDEDKDEATNNVDNNTTVVDTAADNRLNGGAVDPILTPNKLKSNQQQPQQLMKVPKLLSQLRPPGRSDCIQVPPPIIPDISDGLIVECMFPINPSQFYTHINHVDVGRAQWEDLEEQLNNCYNKSSLLMTQLTQPSQVDIGSFWVCCWADDSQWYRCRIVDVKGQEALIYYVDYGNKEWVKCSDLKPLTRQFATYPALAVKCCLSNVLPLNNNDWSDDSIDYFKETIADKPLTAFVANKPEKFDFDSTLSVFLWTTDDSDDESKEILVNSHLVINKFAATDNSEWIEETQRAFRELTPPQVMNELIPKLNSSFTTTTTTTTNNNNNNNNDSVIECTPNGLVAVNGQSEPVAAAAAKLVNGQTKLNGDMIEPNIIDGGSSAGGETSAAAAAAANCPTSCGGDEVTDVDNLGHNKTNGDNNNNGAIEWPKVNGHNGLANAGLRILPEMESEFSDDNDWDPMFDGDIGGGSGGYNNINNNDYSMNPYDPRVMTLGYRLKDRKTCKFYGTRKGCRHDQYCEFLHVDPDKRFDCNEAEEEVLKIADTELEENTSVVLRITSIQSPCSFYGVLPFGPYDINQLDVNEQNAKQFDEPKKISTELKNGELFGHLRRYYDKQAKQENPNIYLGIGSLVAYKKIIESPADNKTGTVYCRARVISEDPENTGLCELFNIDFGTNCTVHRKYIYKLVPYFYQFPALAIHCTLTGIEPYQSSKTWTEEAVNTFAQWTLDKNLVAYIIRTEDKYSVELLELIDGKEVFISQRLIDGQFAQKCKIYGHLGQEQQQPHGSDEYVYKSD